jgi:Sec-independent protein secretion pathway component TatC
MNLVFGFLLGIVGFVFGYYVLGPVLSKVIDSINRLRK